MQAAPLLPLPGGVTDLNHFGFSSVTAPEA